MIFIHELKNQFKLYFITTIIIILSFIILLGLYNVVKINQVSINVFLNNQNPELFKLIGLDKDIFTSPLGYYYSIYLILLIVMSFSALLIGIKIILNDRQKNLKEYLFTKPIKRKNIILYRYVVHVLFFLLLIIIFQILSFIFFNIENVEYSRLTLLKINISLFTITITHLSIGLMIGSLTKVKHITLLSLGLMIIFIGIKLLQNHFSVEFLRVINPIDYFEITDLNTGDYPYRFLIISFAIIVFTSSFSFSVYENIDLYTNNKETTN